MPEVTISISKKPSKQYGKIAKVELPNGSKMYVFNKGWGLTPPTKQFEGDLELLLTWGEINTMIDLSKELGYVYSSKSKKKKQKG